MRDDAIQEFHTFHYFFAILEIRIESEKAGERQRVLTQVGTFLMIYVLEIYVMSEMRFSYGYIFFVIFFAASKNVTSNILTYYFIYLRVFPPNQEENRLFTRRSKIINH